MFVLTLHRNTPLAIDEIRGLPTGCFPVMADGDVVARAELDLPVVHVIRFAVDMVRIVPDASLKVEEADSTRSIALVQAGRLSQARRVRCLPLNLGLGKPSEGALAQWGSQGWDVEEGPVDGEPVRESVQPGIETVLSDPWSLLDAGKIDDAIAMFRNDGLDESDMARVTDMLLSETIEKVVLGCWVCRLTLWEGGLGHAEQLLFHADSRVRQEAVAYVGSIAPERFMAQIHLLSRDSDEDVQGIAQMILEALQQRGHRDEDS